jgi:hypothetical protein
VAHSQWLIVEHRLAGRGLIVRNSLPEHRVTDAAAVQKLMNLAQASEFEGPAAPVSEEAGA